MAATHTTDVPQHPQREFATEIVRKLRAGGFLACFAGGCVRDLLLNRPAKDYDVATSARPDEVRTLFGKRKTLAVGESFGVIIVVGPKAVGTVEVATFRTDLEYTGGRRPEGVLFCSPEEDAQRRDFTINGMFYDPIDSRVMDYVGGEADLAAGVVRAIRDPLARMTEDKLRMLRAVRFAATLEFALDPATADAVRQLADQLPVVSAERIAQELRKILVDPHRQRAMQLCAELGLLQVILPEVQTLPGPLSRLNSPGFELAFAALLIEVPVSPVAGICRRLKLSNEERDRIVWLIQQKDALLTAPDLSLSALKRLLAHPYHRDLIALTHARLLSTSADLHPVLFVEEFLRSTRADLINPPPLITGNDLIHLGIRPGPRFRELLELVRDAQLNLEIDSPAAAIELVHQHLDVHK